MKSIKCCENCEDLLNHDGEEPEFGCLNPKCSCHRNALDIGATKLLDKSFNTD